MHVWYFDYEKLLNKDAMQVYICRLTKQFHEIIIVINVIYENVF